MKILSLLLLPLLAYGYSGPDVVVNTPLSNSSELTNPVGVVTHGNLRLAFSAFYGYCFFRASDANQVGVMLGCFSNGESSNTDKYGGAFFVSRSNSSQVFAVVTAQTVGSTPARVLFYDLSLYNSPGWNGSVSSPTPVATFLLASGLSASAIVVDYDHYFAYAVGTGLIIRYDLNNAPNFTEIDRWSDTAAGMGLIRSQGAPSLKQTKDLLAFVDGGSQLLWVFNVSVPLQNAPKLKISLPVYARSTFFVDDVVLISKNGGVQNSGAIWVYNVTSNILSVMSLPSLNPSNSSTYSVLKIFSLGGYVALLSRSFPDPNLCLLDVKAGLLQPKIASCFEFNSGSYGPNYHDIAFISPTRAILADYSNRVTLFSFDQLYASGLNLSTSWYVPNNSSSTASLLSLGSNNVSFGWNATSVVLTRANLFHQEARPISVSQVSYTLASTVPYAAFQRSELPAGTWRNMTVGETFTTSDILNQLLRISLLGAVNSSLVPGFVLSVQSTYGAQQNVFLTLTDFPFSASATPFASLVIPTASATPLAMATTIMAVLQATATPALTSQVFTFPSTYSLEVIPAPVSTSTPIGSDNTFDTSMTKIFGYSVFVIIGFCVVAAIILLAIVCFFLLRLRRRISKAQKSTDFLFEDATSVMTVTTNTDLLASTFLGSTIGTTAFGAGGATTMINTIMPLAIPGFLEMRMSQFNISSKLAEGATGLVYLATPKDTEDMPSHVVLKVIKEIKGPDEEIYRQLFYQELAITQNFSGKRNMVQLYGYFTAPLGMIMKHYKRGSLTNLMFSKDQAWSTRLVAKLMRDITSGLGLMHASQITHNDVKPDNVLIDEDEDGYVAVLCDFSVSSVNGNRLSGVNQFKIIEIEGLTVQYASPELLERHLTRSTMESVNPHMAYMADVFSFGMTSYAMLTRDKPWPHASSSDEVTRTVIRGQRPDLSMIPHLFPGESATEAFELSLIIQRCWDANYRARPDTEEILELLKRV